MAGAFMEKNSQPDAEALLVALGPTAPAFEAVAALATGFAQSWVYTKFSGWILKFDDKKKALFYVLPQAGGFTLSMALRQHERDVLLADPAMAFAAQRLQGAKKYSEGYAVQLHLPGDAQQDIHAYVHTLVRLRTE